MNGSGTTDFDVCIVGAGAVGLACGYAFARQGKSVVVLEENDARIGAGVSSRNSEVIHAGLHYAPGSLKANLCVAGRRLLYDFLAAHRVAFDKCGKLIVATEESEIAAIEVLAARGEANDVEGVERLTARQALALEPGLRTVGALYSAESGVMDAHGYMDALVGEIESRGGVVSLDAHFLRGEPVTGVGIGVSIGGRDPTSIGVRTLVIAAGLGAQKCARATVHFPKERIPALHYGKGSYFTLSGKAPFKRLIYPPPIPGALGIHYRRDLGGQPRFGPDLEFVAREDYRVDPARAAHFETYVRRFWPALPDGALTPDYAGIRPKLHGPDEPQGDFVIDATVPDVVALFGIESPGLTASLAIGEYVAALC